MAKAKGSKGSARKLNIARAAAQAKMPVGSKVSAKSLGRTVGQNKAAKMNPRTAQRTAVFLAGGGDS